MDIRMIMIPIVGAIIGYVTNSIAIWMLFRPLHPIYIGKFKLPFTPGIIPREKDRLAKSVSGIVSSQLLTCEVLESALLSDEAIHKLSGSIDAFVAECAQSKLTVREELNRHSGQERVPVVQGAAKQWAAGLVSAQFEGFAMGQDIAAAALEKMRERYRHEAPLKSLLSRAMDDRVIAGLSRSLGREIDRMVAGQAPELVTDFLVTQADAILDTPLRDIVHRYESRLPLFKETLFSYYRSAVRQNLSQALQSLDLERVVENRIGEFELAEVERLIRSVVHKELRAIIWLGALLGFLIGFINYLFL